MNQNNPSIMRKLAITLLCAAAWLGVLAQSDAQKGKEFFDQELYAKALPFLKKAANAGDIDSEVRLAYMTFTGNEVEMDREHAYAMIDKCIAKGSAYAMSQRALFMLMDSRTEEERKHAVEWFKRAALAGDADAAVYMVNCLRSAKNKQAGTDEEIVKYCRVAADAGNMEGLAWLGVYTFKGLGGITKDEAEGLALIEQAYAKSERNSFEKNCYEAAVILRNHFLKNGDAKAGAIQSALKKYHPEKR